MIHRFSLVKNEIMEPYRKRVYFFQDSTKVIEVKGETHRIKQTIIPEVPKEAILSHISKKQTKGPDDVRPLSHDALLEKIGKIPRREFCCLDIICFPSVQHCKDPHYEVRGLNYSSYYSD